MIVASFRAVRLELRKEPFQTFAWITSGKGVSTYHVIGYGKDQGEYGAVEMAMDDYRTSAVWNQADETGLRAAYSAYEDAQAAQWALAHVNDADPASLGIVGDCEPFRSDCPGF